jgi:hypothetical protein
MAVKNACPNRKNIEIPVAKGLIVVNRLSVRERHISPPN